MRKVAFVSLEQDHLGDLSMRVAAKYLSGSNLDGCCECLKASAKRVLEFKLYAIFTTQKLTMHVHQCAGPERHVVQISKYSY